MGPACVRTCARYACVHKGLGYVCKGRGPGRARDNAAAKTPAVQTPNPSVWGAWCCSSTMLASAAALRQCARVRRRARGSVRWGHASERAPCLRGVNRQEARFHATVAMASDRVIHVNAHRQKEVAGTGNTTKVPSGNARGCGCRVQHV